MPATNSTAEICPRCVREVKDEKKRLPVFRLDLCHEHYRDLLPWDLYVYLTSPEARMRPRPPIQLKPGQWVRPQYGVDMLFPMNGPQPFVKMLQPVGHELREHDDHVEEEQKGLPPETKKALEASTTKALGLADYGMVSHPDIIGPIASPPSPTQHKRSNLSQTPAHPDVVQVVKTPPRPVVLASLETPTWSEATASAFVRAYCNAGRTEKGSLRLLHQAVMYLAEPYTDKEAVHQIQTVVSIVGVGVKNCALVVRRAWELKHLIPRGWGMYESAERHGKHQKISFEWLHLTAMSSTNTQLRDIDGMLNRLKIRLQPTAPRR